LPQKLGPLSDKDSSLGREKVVTLSNYKQRERLVILEIFASSPGRGGVFLSHFNSFFPLSSNRERDKRTLKGEGTSSLSLVSLNEGGRGSSYFFARGEIL